MFLPVTVLRKGLSRATRSRTSVRLYHLLHTSDRNNIVTELIYLNV